MNTNKKGFTLIELLVVIVIIGILATISVATFGGYFKKARDSERQSAVQNIATIMKVLNATRESTNYGSVDPAAATLVDMTTKAHLDAHLGAQGYSSPESKNDFEYTYSFNDALDEFFIGVCSEEDPTKTFVAGTPNGTAAVTGCLAPTGSVTTYNVVVAGTEYLANDFSW